ncbi:gluconokinase [Alteromonas sp. 5E99-2]|uniref:gluconokinase n=1 Tax=Alteromonas sp. 5E99-2 TaxID=2817683 RepID=UPI001A98D262|nr:gluconokinase [Alteromonas sp. 5E99-2]MBO1255925.1 gluconokinase [Alteromonas sp. 5E99-2]
MSSVVFVVMGVSGCGKSAIAQFLAKTCGGKFIEGDDLHTREAKQKMSGGIPLNDSDRVPWLKRIVSECSDLKESGKPIFVTCSALKQQYRDRLGLMPLSLYFLYLDITQETACERVTNRKGHFFPENMVASQFDTLEPPLSHQDNVISIDANDSLDSVLQASLAKVKSVIKDE